MWNQVSLFEKQITGLLKSHGVSYTHHFPYVIWREKNGRVEFNFGTFCCTNHPFNSSKAMKIGGFPPQFAAVFVGLAFRPHSFLVVVGYRGLPAGQ